MNRSMPPRSLSLAVCALMALVSVAPTAQPIADASFLVVNARVFDGERLLEETDVAVEGGTIRAVGRDLTKWSERLPVIDGANCTIMPGLIDAHAHVTSIADSRQALQFGVTTLLDMGAANIPQDQVFDVRAAARTATDMAEVFSAGFLASTRRPAGSIRPLVTSIDDAVRFADARRADGADYLKLQLNGARSATFGEPNMSEAIASALVARAHANRMKAIAHVETLADVDVALAAGVDGLAHVWRRGGANTDIARAITQRGVFVIATLAIPDGFLDGRARLRDDPRFKGRLSAPLLDHLTRPFTAPLAGSSLDELRANYAAHRDGVRSLVQAGATLLVGTDASAAGTPAAHGISIHREIDLLTEAGLSPLQVLRAATARTADVFSLPDRGRIVVGRRADLVMVRGNPIDDITATRDIMRVWRAGVALRR
jgi:imidazolonepropionase-like amidohydrolase